MLVQRPQLTITHIAHPNDVGRQFLHPGRLKHARKRPAGDDKLELLIPHLADGCEQGGEVLVRAVARDGEQKRPVAQPVAVQNALVRLDSQDMLLAWVNHRDAFGRDVQIAAEFSLGKLGDGEDLAGDASHAAHDQPVLPAEGARVGFGHGEHRGVVQGDGLVGMKVRPDVAG